MTKVRTFDELTYWHRLQPVGFGQGWDPGWRPADGAFADNIGRSDPYWGAVLDKAKAAYGDPNMRFNTGDPNQDRHLVFGDGTRVPSDGRLAYHDAANHTTFLLNDDGSVSPLDANGQAGQPIFPAGFRPNGNGLYAPVDPTGRQIAPLAPHPPPAPHGYYDANGVLTPKNARGDYYIDDPATGRRHYFDAGGKPITEQQYRDGGSLPAAPPAGPALTTDEQQSGRAADAVRKLHGELKNRYSKISDAESKLSEVLLNAHATTADGQQKLNAIQQKIVAAVNNPALSLDTPAGEQAFLKFLRGQVASIGEVVTSGGLAADDQSKAIAALTNLYAADPANADSPPAVIPNEPSPAPADSPASPPAAPSSPVDVDAGLGPAESMPDPTLSDLGLGGPLGADPMSSLTSALPAGLSGLTPLGGLGADPLSSLGGLAGIAGPLAGLASQLGQPERRDGPGDPPDDARRTSDENTADTPAAKGDPGAGTGDGQPPPASQPEPQPGGGPGDGAPAAETAPTPAAATTVSLPDGSTATARTPALAAAVRDYLAGTAVDAAYRQAGIELPPPGTPVTNPVDPARLSCGAIGMFKDHYVVALSAVKALQNGDVVPLSSVVSGPDFLGWMDPSAVGATANPPAPPPVPAAVPTG
jgi:hypothetical protein